MAAVQDVEANITREQRIRLICRLTLHDLRERNGDIRS